jgi:hypothetical protein
MSLMLLVCLGLFLEAPCPRRTRCCSGNLRMMMSRSVDWRGSANALIVDLSFDIICFIIGGFIGTRDMLSLFKNVLYPISI